MSNVDRFSNMRAQGQGGTIVQIQEGEGELSQIGYPISIEATTALSIGDRISAVKNNTKTLASNSTGYSFAAISEDMKVAIANPTFNMETTGLTIFYLDGKNYTPVTVPIKNTLIQDMLTTLNKTSITGSAFLNERGDRLLISFGEYFLMGEIDRNNRNVIAYNLARKPLSFNFSELGYHGWEFSSWGSSILLVGDYLIYNGTIVGISDTDETKTKSYSLSFWYKYSGLHCSYLTYTGTVSYSAKAWYNNNTLMTINSNTNMRYDGNALTLRKYIISGNNVISSSYGPFHYVSEDDYTYGGVSSNGKYLIVTHHDYSWNYGDVYCTYYEIDRDTLTVSPQKWRINLGNNSINGMHGKKAYVSNDGAYVLTRNGIFNENGTKIFSSGAIEAQNGYFNPEKWIYGSTMYSITNPDGAEYLASKIVSSTTETDKLYGIATSDLSVGEIGSARALFNTRN